MTRDVRDQDEADRRRFGQVQARRNQRRLQGGGVRFEPGFLEEEDDTIRGFFNNPDPYPDLVNQPRGSHNRLRQHVGLMGRANDDLRQPTGDLNDRMGNMGRTNQAQQRFNTNPYDDFEAQPPFEHYGAYRHPQNQRRAPQQQQQHHQAPNPCYGRPLSPPIVDYRDDPPLQQQYERRPPNQRRQNNPDANFGGNFDRLLCILERNQYGGIKVDFEEFNGKLNPYNFIDWLNKVEKVFDYKSLEDPKRVKLVATKLTGYALVWWDEVQSQRIISGYAPISTWDRMRDELIQKFIPINYEKELFMRDQNLKQNSSSVTEYTEEFLLLSTRVVLTETERQKVARYLNGLSASIQRQLAFKEIELMSDAINYALKADELLKSSAETIETTKPPPPLKSTTYNFAIKCFTCDELGHRSNECPNKRKRVGLLAEKQDIEEASTTCALISFAIK